MIYRRDVAENAASLARWFLLPPVRPEVPRRLANKQCFRALCAEMGVPFARSITPRSGDDVVTFARCAEFPIMVKTAEQWHLLKDRHSVKVVRSFSELCDLYESCSPEQHQRFLIEEFIPGDDWISHGYYNAVNNTMVTFTGRKLLAYPALMPVQRPLACPWRMKRSVWQPKT